MDENVTDSTVETPTGAGQVDATSTAPPAEPTVYELDENALIKPRGYEKPVKFGDYSRGFQSQLTKASQRAAQAERARQEAEARAARFEQERQAAGRQTGQPGSDVFEQLRSLPYLDGPTTASIVEGIAGEIRQRDQVILAALQQMQKMQATLTRLADASTTSSFDAKIGKWLSDGGYPPEASDLAKEIYLAYEGDDLDEEFPRIFADRWAQLERIWAAKREAQLRDARGPRFVPGRGGVTGPSKALQLDPKASPQEIADKLFPLLDESRT